VPVAGRELRDQALLERLRRLGYRAVDEEPTVPGTYSQTATRLVVMSREYRWGGRSVPARLWAADLQDGVVTRVDPSASLEPEVVASALDEQRAPVERVRLADLPERVWRPVLALEDHRFFEHDGVSGRAMARALWANARRGGVAEGGSTITQQLVKNRDLQPRRALDRKVSEAARALALEATWEKAEILQAYLNAVYYGHVDGVGVYGLGRAARVWFGKPAAELALHEAALLAALLQGPNGLHPIRHPDRARERRDAAILRMVELGWASEAEGAAARARPLGVTPTAPKPEVGGAALARIRAEVARDAEHRLEKDLGFEVDTTLDPVVQARAVAHTRAWLARLRQDHAALRAAPLHAVVVVVRASTGEVLAYVGGDPDQAEGSLDRASEAFRQPGSTVKPLLLLHAYDKCGERGPIRPSTLLSDAPVQVDDWTPRNADGLSLGPVPAREALVRSANRPFVHLAQACGSGAMADTVRRAGLPLPESPPPSWVLGAVEASPAQVLQAHTVFATGGWAVQPRLIARIGRPNGTRTGGESQDRNKVAPAGPAYLVGQDLAQAVARGTGQSARLQGAEARGKTGTSSGNRDAWFVGHAEGIAAVVWVGLDKGELGLTGAYSAAPLWAKVMADAVGTQPRAPAEVPDGVTTCRVDPKTGLAPGILGDADAVEVPCLRRARPDRRQPWSKAEADRIGPPR
jgi:penicillin-binding protein 1B